MIGEVRLDGPVPDDLPTKLCDASPPRTVEHSLTQFLLVVECKSFHRCRIFLYHKYRVICNYMFKPFLVRNNGTLHFLNDSHE
jgi:hypothetical protein